MRLIILHIILLLFLWIPSAYGQGVPAGGIVVKCDDGAGGTEICQQPSTGGGGTQYTEGDIDATITGTAFMWEDTSDTLRAVSASKPLPIGDAGGSLTVDANNLDVQSGGVDLATAAGQLSDGHNVTIDNAGGGSAVNIQDGGNAITVDGTITANAGTNLNTSALLTTTAYDAAFGTAGSADAQVRSIQGIASMTPVLTDPGTATKWGVHNEDDPAADLDPGSLMLARRTATPADTSSQDLDYEALQMDEGRLWTSAVVTSLPSVTIGTFPDNEPFNMAQIGGTAVVSGPCEREQPLFVEISQTANAQIVTGTANERIYICSFHVTTNGAEDIALVSGTGSVCATSTAGFEGFGGATAATGWQFVAGGGIMMNYNKMGHGRTDTDADNVCVFQSASGQLGGGFSYVSL